MMTAGDTCTLFILSTLLLFHANIALRLDDARLNRETICLRTEKLYHVLDIAVSISEFGIEFT
jgi:hypothetical protein